jgi:drug/metabolite transporter (DMT)-like permease
MQKIKVHTAALFAMVFWGISFIWSKIVFEIYSPLTTIFFRLIISVIFLFTLMLIIQKWERIKKEDYGLILLSSFFQPFLYFIGENYGLHQVSASVTAFIIATIPVFSPFVAYKVFRERLSRINIFGLVLAFIGIIFMVINPNLTLNASIEGVALLFLAVFSAVIYSVFLKKLSVKYRPVTIIGWQNLTGTIYFLPLFLFFDLDNVTNIMPGLKEISSLFMLGILSSSMAFVLFTFVIKNIGISKGNIYTNLIPVFAGIAAYFFLGERFTIINLIGMTVIIFGVSLSELDRRKKLVLKKK